MQNCGVDAILVGESLMRSQDKAGAIAALRGEPPKIMKKT
jgi:indole-3-glycerol phosphate synthase